MTDSKCERCGSKLALGMAIVKIGTLNDTTVVKLCGACQDYLKTWLKSRPNRPA